MKLQRTYKPKDYYELIKGEIPVSCGTLQLICNNFKKLKDKDKKELLEKIEDIDMYRQEIKEHQNEIRIIENFCFFDERKIIEIFQRNNI